jgi:hypothetical protein
MIETDFLLSRLTQDWDEFGARRRTAIAQIVPPYNRQDFSNAFDALKTKGCHPDVLFPCLYVFLNSRPSHILPWTRNLKFPSSEQWKQLRDRLDNVSKHMETLESETALATLMVGNRDLDLKEFSSFYEEHNVVLVSIERYLDEIHDICLVLPKRMEIIKQYGQAVISYYVSDITQLSAARSSALTQTLLELFYDQNPPEGDIPANWDRDLKRFQDAYPEFYKSANSLLTEAHLSALNAPLTDPDWKRFVEDGSLE